MSLMENEHHADRWRIGSNDSLHRAREVKLGTVTDDVKNIEIIRYESPILLVKVVENDGKLIENPRVGIDYTSGNPGRYR